MKEKYFYGKDNNLEPRKSLYAVADGSMKSVGHLLAASICQNGPPPNFLAKWVYGYISSGVDGVIQNLPPHLDDSEKFGSVYNKVKNLLL